jgi:DNA-binding CsgD family transcriptional regulator
MRVKEEQRRVSAVLEAAAASHGLSDFVTTTLAAIDEHLGFAGTAFMLTLDEPARAYAGARHGTPHYVLEEYFERWVAADPLASPAAQAAFSRRGHTSLEQIYDQLGAPQRRFVDDFLRRTGDSHQVSFRLAAGTTNGYLTLMGSAEPDASGRRMIEALIPPLTTLMRAHLPRGIDGVLSPRERAVAELVTLGLTNREIGAFLNVEEDTVKKHVSHALAKLGQQRRTQLAVAWAVGSPIDPPR